MSHRITPLSLLVASSLIGCGTSEPPPDIEYSLDTALQLPLLLGSGNPTPVESGCDDDVIFLADSSQLLTVNAVIDSPHLRLNREDTFEISSERWSVVLPSAVVSSDCGVQSVADSQVRADDLPFFTFDRGDGSYCILPFIGFDAHEDWCVNERTGPIEDWDAKISAIQETIAD